MPVISQISERDGLRCVWCEREVWPGEGTLEHLLPRSRRGQGTPENLALACRLCNRRRGTRPPVAHLRALLASGEAPGTDRLREALERLTGSSRRAHAEFARRQLSLLDGV